MPRSLLAGAVLGVLLVGVLVISGMLVARPIMQSESLENQLDALDLEACDSAPASWGWASGDQSFFAYDRTGHSANEAAPTLEGELLRETLATNQAAKQLSEEVAIFLIPRAPEGPCALLRISTRDPATVIGPGFLVVLVGSVVAAMLLAVVGTLWFVVRPLRARIEGLSRAAQRVGSDEFSPQKPRADALGNIAEVLSRSHRRILESREELEQRNRALEDHLAGIAHDLRTPLSSMHLALEAVAAESEGNLQEEARRALADAVYLSSLVENLHQATRLRHDVDVSSGTVELAELVRRLEQRFAIVGRHANVAVAANAPEHEVWAACTPAMAERAVANLIQNAIEHNNSPGNVAITLSVEDSRFALVVADDGPGLPEGTLASLKEETFLLDAARRRNSGLGMLITAEVARRAGWSVSYEHLEPTGVQVRLEGPVTDAPRSQS
jgi:signal transduction histidine kinase